MTQLTNSVSTTPVNINETSWTGMKVKKRAERGVVDFDPSRIFAVVDKAFKDTGERISDKDKWLLVDAIANASKEMAEKNGGSLEVEQIQDQVIEHLYRNGYTQTGESYVLFRARREQQRLRNVLSQDDLDKLNESKNYLPTDLQMFQYLSKYSRFLPEKGRRETWVETVDRVVGFFRGQVEAYHKEADPDPMVWDLMRESMMRMEAFPSMRTVQMAGPAAERENLTCFNCAYCTITKLKDFSEILYVLMQGTGMGFSVEHDFVEDLPKVKLQTGVVEHHKVEDSTEGWCDALNLGIESWYNGKDVVFDYSAVRPAGAKLLTKGGRASGPDPLRELLDFSRDRILARQRKRLQTIDVHDIACKIGKIVQVGGVRRAAMISLSSLEDTLMRDAKKGEFWNTAAQRTMANNSAVYEDTPDTLTFMSEWLALAKSGSGERGIFNRSSLRKTLPKRRKYKHMGTNPCVTADTWVMTDEGPKTVEDLVIDCYPNFGAVVDGKVFEANTFFKTGYKEVVKLSLSSGQFIKLTRNHKVKVADVSRKSKKERWVEAGDLKPGDSVVLHNHRDLSWGGAGTFGQGWLLGELVGDGTFGKYASLDFWGEEAEQMTKVAVCAVHEEVGGRSDLAGSKVATDKWRVQSSELTRLAEQFGIGPNEGKEVSYEVEHTSSDFHAGFLRGYFDADGSVQGDQEKGVSIRLSSSKLRNLRACQRMLARLGIQSKIYEGRRGEGKRMLPDGKGGYAEFDCNADHELVISKDNIQVFAERIGFATPAKAGKLQSLLGLYKREPNRERFVSKVVCVESAGSEYVYDCQVPGPNAFDGNGLYVHNCGEILLRSRQLCNLSIAICRPEDTVESLMRKVRSATIFGTMQSLLTRFNYVSQEWVDNCNEERLLGVDLAGAQDCPLLQPEHPGCKDLLNKLREEVLKTNRYWANVFGVAHSTAATCIKPGGNSGVFFNCGHGITGWVAPFMKRHVRVNAIDPMAQFLIDQKVPHCPDYDETDAANPRVWVFAFPLAAPKAAKVCSEVEVVNGVNTLVSRTTALEQLDTWRLYKTEWTEHNPSVTINVSPDEWFEVGNWVLKNWDIVGGLSFLPRSGRVYPLAPMQEITEDEYNKLVDDFPVIDWSKFFRYELEDTTTLAGDFACVGGACEL